MAKVLDNSLSFVRDVELPSDSDLGAFLEKLKHVPASSGKRRSLIDNEKSAQVNAGSLTSFTEKLSGQNKEDVQNSTLFAQLGSDKKFDRNTQPMDWYGYYTYILGGIGWNQPAFAFDSYTSGGTTVQLDKAVLGILAAIATGNEIAMIAETMEGLKALGDDSKQMLIWDSNSNSGNNGNFQIFPVDRLPNDDVVMVLDGMQFNATSSHYRFLWWTWDTSSILIQRAANKFVLNESVYSRVRQQIKDKLGDRAEQLVDDIEI